MTIRAAIPAIANFYPRPPGGGRPAAMAYVAVHRAISIHALRVEGDRFFEAEAGGEIDISIHALRVEGDADSPFDCAISSYFYPRPPGGGRPGGRAAPVLPPRISIHALRVEGDISATTS